MRSVRPFLLPLGLASRITAVREAVSAHGYAGLMLGYTATLWAFWLAEGSTVFLSTTFFALVAVPVVGLLGFAYGKARPWLALAIVALSFQVIAAPIDTIADTHGALSLLTSTDKSGG